jgi:serine/threonine protein kinase
MDTMRLCPQCLEALPPDSSSRLCVRCQSDPGRTTPRPSCAGIRPAPPTPAEIAQFFPQLEILELLGHGGMGMVYKARQPQLNRFVALKILAPELSGEPAFAERFSREAQSLAKLNHSNIVGVFDFGQAAGFYYFLMEYVDGANLHDLFHGKQLAPDDARRIILDICQALQFAHEEGVVHRDIKPSNILIDKKGRVKIADFGLAKLAGQAGEDPGRAALTTAVMGTPHYIAPEQVERPSAVDHRADLYSLGVVYYEMLTGELPLGRFEPPSRKCPAVDARLDEVVLRALEKDPDRRYQNASEIRTAVEAVTGPLQTFAAVPPVPRKAQRNWSYLRQFTLMAGTAMIAVFFYVLLKDHWPWKQSRPNPPPARTEFNAGLEGSLIGKRITGALQLTKPQVQEVNRTIRRYQREFVGLERRHTEHTQDKAGHVHITVQPFLDDTEKLMTRMWQDLGAVLSVEQIATARTLDFEKFFPNTGRSLVHVEIWRDPNGEEHYVESEDPGPNAVRPASGGLPTPMPPRYRSYLDN